MARTIRFKSTPENWRKEYLGLKCNTLRKFNDLEDIRKELCDNFKDNKLNLLSIEIKNTLTSELFTRKITDVTYYDGYYIISWGLSLN